MAKVARMLPVRNSSVGAVLWNPSRPCRAVNSRTTMRSRRPTLLWIDDFELGLEMYRAVFEELGFRVLTASSGHEGLAVAAQNHVDVVVTDYEMPEMDGEAVSLAIKALNPATPVVLFSGSTLVSHRTLQTVDACCDKAGSREQLLATIQSLLQNKRCPALQPAPLAQASDHGQRTVA